MPKNRELPSDEGGKEEVPPSNQETDPWETQYFNRDISNKPEVQDALRRAKEKQELKEARKEVEKRFEEEKSIPENHAVIIKPFKPGSLQEKLYNEKVEEEIRKLDAEQGLKQKNQEKKPWWKFWE